MRIVYVIDAFAVWGGIERVLADKMNYLVEHSGWEVTLMTISQCDHPLTFELHPSIRHIDLDVRMHQQYQYRWIKRLIKRRELELLLKRRFSAALKEISPDLIVCTKLDLVSVLTNLKGDTPLVVESHTLCKSEKMDRVGWLRNLYIQFLKRCIRKADALVALTEGDAADWRYYNNKTCVIPNIVNLNDSGHYATCLQKAVIYVGRFSSQKDIDSLLRVWEMVYRQHPDFRLDIYGEGKLKDDYLPIIHAMNANIHVYNPTADIMTAYREHSILLLTSRYEPFGLVLPEAMSCGLPVVAFDCPYGPADIVTDGVDGFLIKGRSIDAFARRVCQLIEDADLRQKMGKAGILSSQRYRASCIMPQWSRLFQELTTHTSSPTE
jgi:glycosyltransferase involved in cell wall biosynthesis